MKRNRIIILFILLQVVLLSSSELETLQKRFQSISGNFSQGQVSLDFKISNGVLCDSIAVYRNYNPIEIPIDIYKLPIRKVVVYASKSFLDTDLADNIDYYYLAVGYYNGEPWAVSENLLISVPNLGLNNASTAYKEVHIVVDKRNYCLKIIANNFQVLKKYPLVMGENPFTRKVIRDRVSSPEGIYQMVYILKNATNYKALDIDYPNTIDRVRYELSKDLELIPQNEAIGGDIQIHGMGINTNWTMGSFALRNSDIDEIINSDLIKPGSKVIITGYELTSEDIQYLDRVWTEAEIKIIQDKLRAKGYGIASDGVLGPNSRKILGNFQYQNGLKVTCELDRLTCQRIGYIPYDVKP